jgi:hypothetical protein
MNVEAITNAAEIAFMWRGRYTAAFGIKSVFSDPDIESVKPPTLQVPERRRVARSCT